MTMDREPIRPEEDDPRARGEFPAETDPAMPESGDPMLNTTASEEMRERDSVERPVPEYNRVPEDDRGVPEDQRALDEQRGLDGRNQMGDYRERFEALQAEFIERPREAVEKAESLIEEAVDGMMNSLRDRVRRVHSEIGDGGDTERLRLAMRGYRDLIDTLGGGRI